MGFKKSMATVGTARRPLCRAAVSLVAISSLLSVMPAGATTRAPRTAAAQWSPAREPKPSVAAPMATSAPRRVSWQSRRPSQPGILSGESLSTPITGAEQGPRLIAPAADVFSDEGDSRPVAIVPTRATTSGLDPFADPFAEDEPADPSAALRPFVQTQQDQGTQDATGDPFAEEGFAQGPETGLEPCPSPKDLKRIGEITSDITAKPGEFPQECPLGDEEFLPRQWCQTTYTWKASGLCHKPLYFEEVALERYGHSWGPLVQPVVSGAHFFGTVPILPYKMGLEPPWECMYPLGYYRPGSCAPYTLGPIPISLRGALLEGGAVTGLIYVSP